MKLPLIEDNDGYILKIIVKTGAKNPGIESIENDILKIRLKSLPKDGLANKELIEKLSEILKIPKSKIEIIKGLTSKIKTVKIKGQIG